MKKGNWVPISKALAGYLPKDRAYTELEAAFCMQVDYDHGTSVTILGYSNLWGWSRKRVARFLMEMDVTIVYPENTVKKRKQRGHIAPHKGDMKGTIKGHKRFIDFRCLDNGGNIKGTTTEHKRNIRRPTTRDPNPKTNNKNRKISLPNDYNLSEKHIQYARSKGIEDPLDDIFEEFSIYHRKKGSEYVDWYAAWQSWCRNHLKFRARQEDMTSQRPKEITPEDAEDLYAN